MLTPDLLRFLRCNWQTPFGLSSRGASRFLVIALLSMLAAGAQIAFAQPSSGTAGITVTPGSTGTTGIDNTGNAGSEMAACMNGKTQQAQDTCMTEVRNADAEKRAGKLQADTGLSSNAMKRCEVFQKPDDQAACQARVLGEQNIQGGVAAGGVLRQHEAVVPARAIDSVPVKP